MRLLLDTHALLWWWGDDAQLSAAARAAMGDERHEVLVSAASAWEISTKQRLGKLSPVPADAVAFLRLVADDGFALLPVDARHAWRAGALAHAHRDPFDRMLAAQCELESLTLVTRDPAFAALGTRTLW
jgi:PIN domain nuclease of toxin-antitoxin system